MTCRHCQSHNVNRPRGLCWGCYYRPGLRDLYPSTSRYARRGVGNGHLVNAPIPQVPTAASPGSNEKLRVLAERAKRDERLHHPNDAVV